MQQLKIIFVFGDLGGGIFLRNWGRIILGVILFRGYFGDGDTLNYYKK